VKNILRISFLFFIGQSTLSGASESFAIIGDAGEWNANTRSVLASIQKTSVKKLILPGDNLYSGSTPYEKVWSSWKQAGMRFSIVAIGNHNGGYLKEVAYFKMPGEYYDKNIGSDVKFIVLNSDDTLSNWIQTGWLEEVLALSHERFIFVVYHHPSLTLSKGNNWREKEEFHNYIRPILFKYRGKITAVINGHDHSAALYHFNDLPVIVSGATHGVREPGTPNNIQEKIQVRTNWVYDMTPHWVKMTVEDDFVHLEFVRASDNFVGYRSCIVPGLAAGEQCSAMGRGFAKNSKKPQIKKTLSLNKRAI
jgi:hypothetical protein